MAITPQGILSGAMFGLAVLGLTYSLTDEAQRADIDVGTGIQAVFFVAGSWLIGVVLWNLAWAPARIHREEALAHSSLRAATAATETALAILFQEGQTLGQRKFRNGPTVYGANCRPPNRLHSST